jgi:hypothetical protein
MVWESGKTRILFTGCYRWHELRRAAASDVLAEDEEAMRSFLVR